ncbi:MAG TPA: family 10 glycosylhydrolase, partial [Terriglobia bacterium]|nr:family 10 glycosylhydrolase [Terriglobia bacterium]
MVSRRGFLQAQLAGMAVIVCNPHRLLASQAGNSSKPSPWINYVRISGNPLRLDRVDEIIREATESHVFGIETDNDIEGRYESFLDPAEKLKAIKAVAEKAHAAGNYTFVYVAGLECITANAADVKHSLYKDHPDWVQRKITGEPALFGGGTAFWIRKGDEDVWVSPYPPEWRKIYMEHVRQIAATGIDGIYVDIPYWMTHFTGWEKTWASFDKYTVAEFKKRTGLNAMTDLKLGDFSDANFRRWVDFRITTITEFMKEIGDNFKSVNPKGVTIAEIYPGIEFEAVRVGSDVYQLYDVIDLIAHEYEWSGVGNASRKTPLDWLHFMIGMYSFRAFAGRKPTWMLSYSWD